MKPKLKTITLGCSKNTVDTQHLLWQVKDSYDILPEEDEGRADVLLINTCGFIGDAKEESIQTILQAAAEKAAGKVGKLLVFGCLSQRYPDELPGLIPEVDGWFGARDLDPLVKALGCTPQGDSRRFLDGPRRPYAYLKISEGCDRRCSYCAIPFIRGRHISVPLEKLEDEARQLASEGVKELIVIAQDTTFYGLDLYGKRCLAQLLRRLSAIDGIEWIRIHYSYPADFPEDVLDEMANNPKVCRYMDIPLQHVSNPVLANMHRGVDGKWTRELILKMRDKVPGVALRTTLIVGHPGETHASFQELLRFVADAKFQRMGAFKYSEEEGTWGAANLKDSVRESTKENRLKQLMTLQRGISLAYNKSRIGSVVKVLADSFSGGTLVCRSEFESPEVDGEILVREFGANVDPRTLVGQFLNVRILEADEYDLIAKLV